MPKGTVKWFNDLKGFGFIRASDGSGDIFVHRKQIAGSGAGHKTLLEGQSVEYDGPSRTPKGPQADNVRVLTS